MEYGGWKLKKKYKKILPLWCITDSWNDLFSQLEIDNDPLKTISRQNFGIYLQ